MFGLQPLPIQIVHDKAFDVELVTNQFFKEYKVQFDELEDDLKIQVNDRAWAHDYSLQFLNRSMFIYFIQRKGWLGNDRDFLFNFWKTYQRTGSSRNTFVDNWLNVLFFEAFNDKFHEGHTYFPPEIRNILSLAPFLNGGLFTENEFDKKHKATISDRRFEQILKFLEGYNFTIAEDSPLDKEVAVDPEMIGKVYESLVNVSDEVDTQGEAGIFYTPRTEIDLMCRLSLVDNLANHMGQDKKSLLYQLVFALEPDEKTDADKAVANVGLWGGVNERLDELTVLDPACGSGSFLVGMLNILDDLQERANHQLNKTEAPYERKKRIIGQTLYGVDVMGWACHTAELRLWLALIIDAEIPQAELHIRPNNEPLLPHFTFKIRHGDSLVQEIGGVNFGHKQTAFSWNKKLKARIDDLKIEKLKYYNNDTTCRYNTLDKVKQEERSIFQELLEDRVVALESEIQTWSQRIATPQTQLGMIGLPQKPLQSPLEIQNWKQERDHKQEELAQVKQALNALHNSLQVPFVWDIAFVEIFESEKNGFDIVIGNPPYVRQEAIAAPLVNGIQITADKKTYKDKLALSVYQAFPPFFGYNATRKTVVHKINAKSDLYIYFYLHGLSLLNYKGSFCFITSNSWLDVGYGAELQEFLLKHSHIKMVLDNKVRRTFANAAVNSIIALFSAPDDSREWARDKTARFVMFRVPFEYVVSPVIFEEIEEATELKACKEYRVFPIPQIKLLEDGCEIPEEEEENGKTTTPLIKVSNYMGNKWGGKYLRAPDIYWTILEKAGKRIVSLGDIGHVRYPIKTGINEFFYVDETKIEEFGIEKEYLLPVVKSPKDFAQLHLKRENIKVHLFCCDLSLSDLRRQGKKGALSYIEWGQHQVTKARQKTTAGIAWPEVPSVSGRRQWYTIDNIGSTDVICNRFFDRRFFFGFCDFPVIEDQTFYGLTLNPKHKARKLGQIALLNSTSSYLFTEVLGRVGLGLGVLQYARIDMEKLLTLDILSFDLPLIERLLRVFDVLSTRPIMSIFDETNQNDRRALDLIIFEALGIAPEQVDYLYESLLSLIQERLSKADSLAPSGG
jgi:hypothetical protein